MQLQTEISTSAFRKTKSWGCLEPQTLIAAIGEELQQTRVWPEQRGNRE